MDSILEGLSIAKQQDPRFQWAWENVGHGALKLYPTMREQLGEGILVYGCAYGRKSLKSYRVWLSPEAKEEFTPIHPTDKESLCKTCKKAQRVVEHKEGMCPRKGSQ